MSLWTQGKGLLNEAVQQHRLGQPVYTFASAGQPHAPTFTASVQVDGLPGAFVSGEHRRKIDAEKEAGYKAYCAIVGIDGGSNEVVAEENDEFSSSFVSLPSSSRAVRPPAAAEATAIAAAGLATGGNPKGRLLELAAVQRSLLPVEFEVQPVGPDHSKLFYGSVLLGDGREFACQEPQDTKKLAERAAAAVALQALAGPPVAARAIPAAMPAKSAVSRVVHQATETSAAPASPKNRLLDFCQARRVPLPSFDHQSHGQGELSRFRATVSLFDQSFEGRWMSTKKAAEADAASVACEILDIDAQMSAAPRLPAGLLPLFGSAAQSVIVAIDAENSHKALQYEYPAHANPVAFHARGWRAKPANVNPAIEMVVGPWEGRDVADMYMAVFLSQLTARSPPDTLIIVSKDAALRALAKALVYTHPQMKVYVHNFEHDDIGDAQVTNVATTSRDWS